MDKGSESILETMEGRRMLAGNVTASIVGGVLVVQGDNKSNAIVIAAHSTVNTTVTPAPGTTVNGDGTATFVGTPPIVVDMGNGDDSVTFVDLDFQRVSVTTGNGNDRVIGDVDGSGPNIFSTLRIDTGNGDDFVHLGGSTGVASDLTIVTGNGDDTVELVDATGVGGNMNIVTGNGDDRIRLAGSFAIDGSLTLNGGSGFDVLDASSGTFTIGGAITVLGIESFV
jgi:hypothetical protein